MNTAPRIEISDHHLDTQLSPDLHREGISEPARYFCGMIVFISLTSVRQGKLENVDIALTF